MSNSLVPKIINHLNASGIFTGYAFTDYRDDGAYPFKELNTPCVLVRVQGGSQDRDIGAPGVDIYVHTKAQATNSDRGALYETAAQLDRYLTTNTVFDNVQHIEMPTSSAGVYKDGQERFYTAHRITVRRSGV